MSRASNLLERFVRKRAIEIPGFDYRTSHFKIKPPSALSDVSRVTGMPSEDNPDGEVVCVGDDTPYVADAIGECDPDGTPCEACAAAAEDAAEPESQDDHGGACCASCAASGGHCGGVRDDIHGWYDAYGWHPY